MKCDSHSE